MIYISKEEVKKLSIFQKNIYFDSYNELYKILPKYYKVSPKRIEEFLTYINGIPTIEGLLQPIDLIQDEFGIYGYKMNRLINANNIDTLLNKSSNDLDIISLINEMFNTLEDIHKYFLSSMI